MYCGAYSPDQEKTDDIYVAYNFQSAVSSLALPKLPKDRGWYLAADTSDDAMPCQQEPRLCENQRNILLNPQSICILMGQELPQKNKLTKKKDKLQNG